MQAELISVIIPIYNVKDYLVECIESVMEQTYKNIEILLIDDGSTDGSAELCDEFEKRDARIKVYHKENGGVSSARNYGLKKATGELIGFLDADDTIHPQMYEILYDNMLTHGAMLSYCLIQRMYGTQKDNGEEDEPIVIEGKESLSLKAHFKLVSCPYIGKSVCDKLFRREILGGVYFDERYSAGEDNLFVTRVLLKEPICVYAGKALYLYRDERPGNSRSAGRVSNKMFTQQIPVKRQQIELLQQSGHNDIAEHERLVFYKELLRYHKIIGSDAKDAEKKEFYSKLREVVIEDKHDIKRVLKSKDAGWKCKVKYKCWFVSDVLLRILELAGK